MNKSTEIDNYISSYPADIQEVLELLRETIRTAAPDAKEVISYSMPAFKLKRVLVYFAAYSNHIGFYPTASGIEMFNEEFSTYKWSKGAVQFPINKPLPLDLITRIVEFRVKEDSKIPQKKNSK